MRKNFEDITSSAAIEIEQVSKRFAIQHARSVKERLLGPKGKTEDFLSLDRVSATILPGETVGLIGHNGSGKSTLLKVIGGILEPSAGRVIRRGRLAALLELGAGFNQDLTGRENIFLNASILGLSRTETSRYLDSIIAFSELEHFIDTQVKFYSSGMYVRLAFAIAVHVNPDVLLVDEVLAVGDEPFQRKCLARIREFQDAGKTIVLVSHSAEQIADVCTRTIVLDSGKIVFDGEVGAGLKALRDSFDSRSVERSDSEAEPDESRPIEIRNVSVLVDDNENRMVRRGDSIRVRVDVDVKEQIPWMCGMNFLTPLGHSTYRVDTNGLGAAIIRPAGSHSVEFILRGTNFGATRLTLAVAVASPNGELFHRINNAAEIDIQPDELGRGDIQFDTTIEVG